MTLSRAEIDTHRSAVFCLPVRIAHRSTQLRERFAKEKVKSIIYLGRHYYAFGASESYILFRGITLRDNQMIIFKRIKPGKLIWSIDLQAVKGYRKISSSLVLQTERACLEREMNPPLDVLEIIGQSEDVSTRALDDYHLNRFRVYLDNTLSSLPPVEFEEPLTLYTSYHRHEVNYRLAESGRGMPIVDRQNSEVCAEVFPTEIFILLPLERLHYPVYLLEYLLTQAIMLREKHFGTPEKVTAWKLEEQQAAVTLAPQAAAALLNTHHERVRRNTARNIRVNKKRADKALAMLAEARRKLAMAEALQATIAPMIRSTEEDARRLIEDLRQLRSVTEVAMIGDELRVTTDTIYSTLVTENPRRMFRIGQIQMHLNVITYSIRFTNLTEPKRELAAPHIGQGAHGCLDSQIEFQVKTHLANNEWVPAIQVCMRLLTASRHPEESILWPEVDPKTRLPLVAAKTNKE